MRGVTNRLRRRNTRLVNPGHDVHIHFHDEGGTGDVPARMKKRQEEDDEDVASEPPTVIVNVPETPVTVDFDATFELSRPDEVVETETFIERDPIQQRIQKTEKISKTRRAK